jgi:hypothetical protein
MKFETKFCYHRRLPIQKIFSIFLNHLLILSMAKYFRLFYQANNSYRMLMQVQILDTTFLTTRNTLILYFSDLFIRIVDFNNFHILSMLSYCLLQPIISQYISNVQLYYEKLVPKEINAIIFLTKSYFLTMQNNLYNSRE